jgi:5-methylcytosine-specific restriction enzyme A
MQRIIKPLLRRFDSRSVRPPAKKADAHYLSPAHTAWRFRVIGRAGGQCEAMEVDGTRCSRRQPYDRMFADHIAELSDGGSALDPNNGQCLCAHHHGLKTIAARVARLRSVEP